jgi:RNA polymerase sigma-70 factor (ECF subfamily)
MTSVFVLSAKENLTVARWKFAGCAMAGINCVARPTAAIRRRICGCPRRRHWCLTYLNQIGGVPPTNNRNAARLLQRGPNLIAMIGSTLDEPGVASVPDEVLMRNISRRRHDALAELYGRHSKRLRATIDGVVHEEAEADDVLQEIFLQVWEEAGRYSPKAGKPLGWMVTIARRRAIDRLRRRQAYSRARERYEKRVVQNSQSPRPHAAEAFVSSDLRNFLKKSILALPKMQREAVELAFFKGLSHREIAAATHAPLGTVKTRLELGLQKLTHALGPIRNKV